MKFCFAVCNLLLLNNEMLYVVLGAVVNRPIELFRYEDVLEKRKQSPHLGTWNQRMFA